MQKLSSYILTRNSEKYLYKILEKITIVSDEIIIVDSGSTDNTKKIADSFDKTQFIYNEFVNFKEQRIFAEKMCTHNMILFLDSDEIPNTEFIASVERIKAKGFDFDAYTVIRKWNVLGHNIHAIYPVTSPDYPIRLYNKKIASFSKSQLVHEKPSGYKTLGQIKGVIWHYTFQTKEELKSKLALYTDIAAQDLILKKKKINLLKIIFSPIVAFVKWYFLKKGFKDGAIGLILAKYAYDYTFLKYKKAKILKKMSL
jgi:glycosyltransferase involved in cell wall biosynthesis